MRVAGLEPAGVEVEERDDEDGEQQGAVDARPVEDVGSGNEENEVDRRGVCSTTRELVSHMLTFSMSRNVQEKEDGYPASEAKHFQGQGENRSRAKCVEQEAREKWSDGFARLCSLSGNNAPKAPTGRPMIMADDPMEG